MSASLKHKRIVVKVGTSTITDSRGHIDKAAIAPLVTSTISWPARARSAI